MEIPIIVLAVVLIIVSFQMFKYKIGLMFVSEYMERHNISLNEKDIEECKQAVIDKILHKKS